MKERLKMRIQDILIVKNGYYSLPPMYIYHYGYTQCNQLILSINLPTENETIENERKFYIPIDNKELSNFKKGLISFYHLAEKINIGFLLNSKDYGTILTLKEITFNEIKGLLKEYNLDIKDKIEDYEVKDWRLEI